LELFYNLSWLEVAGLVFGLINVILLIRENIWTWPAGIIYILISLAIFWEIKLYADFGLHLIYFVINIYGWYNWSKRSNSRGDHLPVTSLSFLQLIYSLLLSTGITLVLGWTLSDFSDASLPYWDSATSVFSITGVWLSARKKIESWYYWFFVDITASGIYVYKEIYFYALLYLVYILLAVFGYLAWRKTLVKRA